MQIKCLNQDQSINFLMPSALAVEDLAHYFDGDNKAFGDVAEIILKMITEEIGGTHILKSSQELGQVMLGLELAGGSIKTASKREINKLLNKIITTKE